MKSIDAQIKELRQALGVAATKAASLNMIRAGIEAGDMPAIETGWELQDGLSESLDRALNILNGDAE